MRDTTPDSVHRVPVLPLVLGGVTALMVLTQLLTWTQFTDALYTYQIGPEVIVPTFALILIGLEALAAALAWPHLSRRWHRTAAAILLLVWVLWAALVVGALTRGIPIGNLGIFGALPPLPAFIGVLFIPVVMIAATMIALVQLKPAPKH